ncbi:hypothetical protein ACVWXO_009101 [Bradyrhizobium sp. LM2.7]
MQHLPNDTIDVPLDQFGQIETVYGDPNFPTTTDAWGGNDTVTATISRRCRRFHERHGAGRQ